MSADATPLNPADLECIPWPPEPKHGMLTGQIPRGILILHKPTGIAVARTDDRNQHRNKAAALAELTKLVCAVQPEPERTMVRDILRNGCLLSGPGSKSRYSLP